MNFRKKLISAAFTTAMTLFASSSYADLLYQGAEPAGGAGIGTVNTILTFQNAPRTTVESASVGLTTGGALLITGDASTGASQTQVRSFSSLGVTDAGSLRIIFNANEPAGNSIGISSLALNVFNPTSGNLLFSSNFTGAPLTFDDTFTGTGSSGFVFALDAADVATLQALLALPDSGSNVIGISASAFSSTGGPETIYIGATNVLSAIPEPETYGMLLAGLGLMGFAVRRRSSKKPA